MITEYDLTRTASAHYSDCRLYRYRLTRSFVGPIEAMRRPMLICGLNPSTASAFVDDPTIRREIGFARTLGFDGLLKINMYGLRSTDPRGLLAVKDPNGPENDAALAALPPGPIVCAWGSHKAVTPERVRRIVELFGDRELLCFGVNANGAPRHPLYIKGDTKPVPWAPSIERRTA